LILAQTGSVSQQQYDSDGKHSNDVLRTNVDFMEENTLLKAPFTGVITGKYFEDGEHVFGYTYNTVWKISNCNYHAG